MLREVQPPDFAVFFDHQLDPVSNWQVAFTHEDPTDWDAFNAHFARALDDETVLMRKIVVEEGIAGYLTKYDLDGEPQIGFVLGPEYWGKGIATQSLREFLEIVTVRPVYARTAFDNHASMKVLQKTGFVRTSEGQYFSNARGVEIVEILWTLPDERTVEFHHE
ncbi:MAG TPA: GNAT family N-acetyltransferase [Candidatus Nanopelagicaceae bacterium]|nr:GNAT family N-acetyltransferase [Candidatus Nanopelagicaceae bacterium]